MSNTALPDAATVTQRLSLPPGANLADLVAAITRSRGRAFEVRRMTVKLPPTRHGVWIATDVADHLVVTAVATRECLLHDLAHVILGHTLTHSEIPQTVTYTAYQEKAANHLADHLARTYPNLSTAR